jgi:phage tail-like protein
MADDGSARSANAWPLSQFNFEVRWGSQVMSFQEVTGLDAQAQLIAYRAGHGPVFCTTKVPGIPKFANVTMKEGIFEADHRFWDWFKLIKTNAVKRGAVLS